MGRRMGALDPTVIDSQAASIGACRGSFYLIGRRIGAMDPTN
jgi:hypothetical protein